MILLGTPGWSQLSIILLVILIPAVLVLIALIDILRNEFTGSNKLIWLLLVLLLPVLGMILYFTIGKEQKIKG